MLQFILGRAASGKTTAVISMLRELTAPGREAVLIVPEQFSFDTERDILEALGDKTASLVKVMSFTRLCDEIERNTGGGAGAVLSDAHKLILLNRALKICEPELKIWKRYISFPGFTASLLESIEEFKLNAITPQQLLAAAEMTEGSVLRDKLFDAAAVLLNYNALIAERFIDPSDRLTRLAERLLSYRYFDGKTVFLDSFKGFTGQQYKIIDRILAQASEVTVCLTAAPESSGNTDIFSNIRKTVSRIRAIAGSHAVKIMPDIFLENEYFKGRSVSSAEKILSGKSARENDGSVAICRAETVYDEAEFAARTIRRTVRENPGWRYRDFVIIVRDTEMYEEAVAAACERNSVSCFFDRRTPLASFPPVAGLIAALEAVRSYSTEQILRFLKSGISPLKTEETADLENYVSLWGIEGKRWLESWNMNPDGFVTEETDSQRKRNAERLENLNRLRERAVAPLQQFEKGLCGTAAEYCAAVYRLFSECRADAAMRKLCSELTERGRLADADALRQSWDTLAALLDSFAECYGELAPERDEFRETLKKAVNISTVGTAPQMLDQVSFGAADRIRPARPKAAFILGANSGVFPKSITVSGLFGNAERKELIALDIDIPDRGIPAAIDEEFLVYSNICCASEKDYITYCEQSIKGEETQPSEFVDRLARALEIKEICEPAALCESNLPETENAAFSYACRRYSEEKCEGITLFSALEDIPEMRERLKAVLSAGKLSDGKLSADTALRLYGADINMSASRLDTFYRCRFRHFCRYGLKISTPQPAEINSGQRGLMVHYVLQHLVENHGKGLSELSDEQICSEADGLIEAYLSSIPGYRSAQTPYLKFLSENVARSTKEVALHLKKEFAQSSFEPVACEFKFGDTGENAAVIPFNGGRLHLNGMIDRVDAYSGYLRIVDYKTGSRSFRLSDIIVGQNMQMLMYLYAVLKDEKYSGFSPAGILYMPAKREKGDSSKLRMNGLLAADETVVYAMEENNAGEFIPRFKQAADSTFIPPEGFGDIFRYLEDEIKTAGEDILNGDISVDPVNGAGSGGDACAYCDFSAVCRIEDEPARQAASLSNSQVLEMIKKKEEY